MLQGGGGGDTIDGGGGDDDIRGDGVNDSGNDVLNGGAGNDYIEGGPGSDVIHGGPGDDALYASAGPRASTPYSAAPVLTVFGAVDFLYGDSGNDLLVSVNPPEASLVIMHGGDGDDHLISLSGLTDMYGGAGNDTLEGSGPAVADYLDSTSGVAVDLRLSGPQDTIGAGVDTLSGISTLYGSPFNDTLTGDAGDNGLLGGPGDDTIDGQGGSDTALYVYSQTGVTVDLTIAGPQNTGEDGVDTLISIENLVGSDSGNDVLTGNAGPNALDGWGGDDTLRGGGGADTLSGGTGNDTFLFAPGDGWDLVADFGAGGAADRIDLSTYPHVASFEQVLAHAVQSGPDTILKLSDEDQVTLSGVTKSALTSADFTVSPVVSPDFGSGVDFNGDGTGDVLWRNSNGIVAQWRIAPGSGTVSYVGMDTANSSWHIQGAADFDGDGKADVLWRNDSGQVAAWDSSPGGIAFQDLGVVGGSWFIS